MPLDIKTLCQYRIARAKEDLMAAENNHQAGFYKAAINRSYYAISDFFIASKEDSQTQLEHAKEFLNSVEQYLVMKF